MSILSLRFGGSVRTLSSTDRQALFDRSTSTDVVVRDRTSSIIRDVRAEGDAALVRMARAFDGAELDALEVSPRVCRDALDRTPATVRRALERAATNITSVAREELPTASVCEPEPGVVIERTPRPLDRVGIYAPGGRAAYPSSVLMGVVPARVAGVREVIVCSPPDASGRPTSIVLAAAALANADRVFAIGGAGAIAAMAYGTQTVPRVDRIAGPGNAYVAEAKLQVVGAVAIDAPAGPSELLVIADETSAAARVALEMIAQAEHDPKACAVAIVVGQEVADLLQRELAAAVERAERRDVVVQSLAFGGGVIAAESVDEAIEFANAYAPEHLLIAIDDAAEIRSRIRTAGSVFLGHSTSVAFGDYITGSNHVLPTGGLARSYSGLSVLDFIRWTSYQTVSQRAAASLARDVDVLARAEGLPGHAAAATAAGVLEESLA
jgi:histidinol dehydrogenase